MKEIIFPSCAYFFNLLHVSNDIKDNSQECCRLLLARRQSRRKLVLRNLLKNIVWAQTSVKE